MLSKIAINATKALEGRSGDGLRRSLAAIPGVKSVTMAYPNRVEVHYDGRETGAGRLMTVIRAFGAPKGF